MRTHLAPRPILESVTLTAPRATDVPVNLEQLPRTVNLVVYRGDDVGLTLTVSERTGEAADLSGATFAAQIRRTPDADEIAGELEVSTTDNVVSLHLEAATSRLLLPLLAWDCEMVRDGWTTTLAAGRLVVVADVTRL
jgi:hypothetical protein